jgi:hypothetical protein
MNLTAGRGRSASRPRRARRPSAVVVACALVRGGAMFALVRNVDARDQQSLLNSQARDARTTIAALALGWAAVGTPPACRVFTATPADLASCR